MYGVCVVTISIRLGMPCYLVEVRRQDTLWERTLTLAGLGSTLLTAAARLRQWRSRHHRFSGAAGSMEHPRYV